MAKIKHLYYGIDSGGMFHLWYLLIPIYILPIVYIFRNKIGLLTLIFGLLNVTGILIQILDINIMVRDALFYGGFYISLGCYIYLHEDYINKLCNISLKYLWCFLIIFNLLQLCESLMFGRMTYYFSTILIIFTIFVIVIKEQHLLENSMINKIGGESLGIYLIHPIIIDIIYLVIYMTIDYIINSIVWQILLTPIVFVSSYGIYKAFIHIYHSFLLKLSNNIS